MCASCWRKDQRGTRPAPEPRCSTKPTIGPRQMVVAFSVSYGNSFLIS